MAGRLSTTTKDVGLLKQLFDDGQLQLSAEFQRNAIWSRPAKAYLVDTILTENPIPVLYFQKGISAQTNRVEYTVVDGQQRLNAIFQFMDNRFSLTESDPASTWSRRRWKTLDESDKLRFLSYDLVIQELAGYNSTSIRDMFRRMNRYVVALNPQERRHALEDGVFKSLVEEIGAWPFWRSFGVVSEQGKARMKNDELVAELLILLNEGPQDKKDSVDLYYETSKEQFPEADELRDALGQFLEMLEKAFPELRKSVLRRPANIYALVGALAELREVDELPGVSEVGSRLRRFSDDLERSQDERSQRAERYFVAQSRQTDNIRPRRTRIEILRQVIRGEE